MKRRNDPTQSKRSLQQLRADQKRSISEAIKAAKAEDESSRAKLHLAAAEAEARGRTIGGACRSCGERSACMLALRCSHVTLCRTCWSEQGAEAMCAECGEPYPLAVELFKPLD